MGHEPVLLEEVVSMLQPEEGDVVLDATCGGGGHSEAIIKKILPSGRLIAIDRDPEAAERTRKRLEGYGDKVIVRNEDYRRIDTIAPSLGAGCVDKVLFDLGMSSYQVDDPERGFSLSREGALDMRFDPRGGMSARDVVNSLNADELADIIRTYGEERHSRLIARMIASERKKAPIETTSRLRDIIARAAGRRYRGQRLHPAVRTFQALRIFVNDELGAVEEGVNKAIDLLCPSGRICVISFHSLEDRVVKNVFRDRKKRGELELITKKPMVPSRAEVERNPRSRSAKLRAAERI